MKVMHVLKHCASGNGGVHVAVDLACAQVATGHEVLLASEGGDYDELLASRGVEEAHVPAPGRGIATVRSAAALLAAARRFRPDVIHAHMMSSAVLGWGVAKLIGVPLVATMHNSFDRHSVLMRVATVVVAVSEAERRKLIFRGFGEQQVVTVLNGADGSARESLDGEDLGPLARPCVITLSGLHHRKAVDDVISAFAAVHPDFTDWHLNIVGWGPDREKLESQVTELGMTDSVHFLGSTVTPRPLLDAADVFASASLADPCPLAVIEARAAGCAIIATAVDGVPEILEHGRAGQLVPTADPAAMASAFRTLIADPNALATWQSRALDGAEHFTVDRMATDYTRVYESVRRPAPSTWLHRRRTAGVRASAGGDRRIRLALFVPPSSHFAGIERVVHEIACGVAEKHSDEVEVHVVFANAYDDQALVRPPYSMHVLGVDRLRRIATSLRSWVAEHDVDILVCPQVEPSVMAWLATRGLRLPVFVPHLHGNPRVEESDGSRRTRLAFAVFRHLVARRVAGVLTVSPSLQRHAAHTVARHAEVRFAKNPVRDLVGVHPRSPRGERFRFLNIARLDRQKGQDILLRALALARLELPDVTLTLVGSGPDEAMLRRLSTELGLDDVVDFVGYAPEPAVHFREADCFVLSSRWEGFGVVLVEALQFGLPLLAADCEFGPADVITSPRIGELVAADNVEALAEGLKRAARRPSDAQDEAFRRAVACAYDRGPATVSQLEALRDVVAALSSGQEALSSFAVRRH